MPAGAAIERISVSAYTVPTGFPESDGTFTWSTRWKAFSDRSRPGLGLDFKRADAGRWAVPF